MDTNAPLDKIFRTKVQHSLNYDIRSKSVKVNIDIYDEQGLREWAKFFHVEKELDLGFYPGKIQKKQTRIFWKKRFGSVSEIPGLTPGWWRRKQGQFRTIVLVKKGETIDPADPGIELSLWGSQCCSYFSEDIGETLIDEESIERFDLLQLSIKFTTLLLRSHDSADLERMFTGEKLIY